MESIQSNIVKPIQRYSRQISNILEENKTELHPQVIYHNILFFDISFYTCVIPFCLKNTGTGSFKIHTNKVQQVITAILHLLTIAYFIRAPIATLKPSEESIIKNPELLIQTVNRFLLAPYVITAVYIFWRKKNVLEKLWSNYQNNDPEKKRNARTVIVNICMVFLVLLLILINIFTKVNNFTWEKWIVDGIRSAIYIFRVDSLKMTAGNDSRIGDFSPLIICLGIFDRILTLYHHLFKNLCILLTLISAIQIYHSCKGFFNALKSDEQDISKVLQHYLKVREVTKRINEFIGKLLPIFVIVLLLNCIDIPKAITRPGWQRLNTYTVLAVCISIFVIAADAHSKINYLKEWLFQFKTNRQSTNSEITTQQLLREEEIYETLKWDCETTKIGLGSQLFTVTYGFLALLVSVGTTYGAIQLQFYNSKFLSAETA